jgi:hypothetical protein
MGLVRGMGVEFPFQILAQTAGRLFACVSRSNVSTVRMRSRGKTENNEERLARKRGRWALAGAKRPKIYGSQVIHDV